MNFVIDLAHRGVSVAQWQSIKARNPEVWSSIPHWDSQLFVFVPRSWQDETLLTSWYWKFIYIISNPNRPIASPVISSDLPHAFILGIPEKT